MTPDELRAILGREENQHLGFKRDLPDAQRLAGTVAALANGGGGTLVLGHDELSGPRGLSHPGVAAEHVREWIKRFVSPLPQTHVEAVELEPGKTLVVVEVEPSSDIHVVGGRIIRRQGARDAVMSPREIVELVSQATRPDRVAEAMAALSSEVERLSVALGWRKQLPLQIAFLISGVILGAAVGYLLGVWNPLG